MNNIHSERKPEIWEIEAYLDGFGGDQFVADFVANNPTLTPDKTETALEAQLFRSSCPDSMRLLNYQWGLSDDQDALIVSAHLATCPHCLAESAELAQPSFETSTPPAHSGLNLGLSLGSRLRESLSGLRFLIGQALLPTDIELSPVRSGAEDESKTQIYHIDQLGWDVIFEQATTLITPFASVQGQLLALDTFENEQIQVSLILDDKVIESTVIDEMGGFYFEQIPKNIYTVCLHVEGVQIGLPYLSIG